MAERWLANGMKVSSRLSGTPSGPVGSGVLQPGSSGTASAANVDAITRLIHSSMSGSTPAVARPDLQLPAPVVDDQCIDQPEDVHADQQGRRVGQFPPAEDVQVAEGDMRVAH